MLGVAYTIQALQKKIGSLPGGGIRHVSPLPEKSRLRLVGEAARVQLHPIDGGPDAVGVIDDWTVRVVERENQDVIHLVCETGGAVPRPFQLGREGLLESKDLRTGDDDFDRLVRLKGPDRVVAALMGRSVRPLVCRLMEQARLEVEDSIVRAVVGRSSGGPDRMGGQLRDVIALARQLAMTPDQNAERLRERVLDDEETPQLRRAALEQLFRRWPMEAAQVEAALQPDRDADLLAQLGQLRDAARQQRAREAGGGGELAVVQGASGALSEAQHGQLTVKKP